MVAKKSTAHGGVTTSVKKGHSGGEVATTDVHVEIDRLPSKKLGHASAPDSTREASGSVGNDNIIEVEGSTAPPCQHQPPRVVQSFKVIIVVTRTVKVPYLGL